METSTSDDRRHPNYPSPSPRCSCHRYSLVALLQLVTQLILCGLLLANLVVTTRNFANTQFTSPNSAAGLFNIELKDLPTRYGSDTSYMSLDPEYDWLWSTEDDRYAGLITLDPPNIDGSTRWGAITMFHQLHCLTSLRTALQRAHRGEDIGLDYRDDSHWPHCLHYLRQGILCHADDTIELPYSWNVTTSENGTATTKRTGSIDGSRDLRVCRDWEGLYELRAMRGYREGTGEDS